MQTTYYETSSFIAHQDNVVDLSHYRQRLAAVSGERFAASGPWEEGPTSATHCPEVNRRGRPRGGDRRLRARRRVLAFWMDVCASGAVLLFAITAMVQFFRLI